MSLWSRRREPPAAAAATTAVSVKVVSQDVEDPMIVHERLVAYVHAINGDPEPRVGVWMEHSYAAAAGAGAGAISARGEAGGGGGGADTRSLLCARPRLRSGSDHLLDVDSVEPPGPAPPGPAPPGRPPAGDASSDDDDDDEEEEEGWEARLEEGAGGAEGTGPRRVVASVLQALRSLRLARLAGRDAASEARVAARRVRLALAGQWAGGGAARAHEALWAALPRRWRRLYSAALAELARATPALAARLKEAPGPARAAAPRPPPACMPMRSRPLLVWLGSGCDVTDARWERRLRALVPTHYVRLPQMDGRSVVWWCSEALGAARAALSALSAERTALLALAGAGAGAALAVALAGSAPDPAPDAPDQPRALLLLAPPLLTAEGPRDAPDDPICNLSIPTLAVVSSRSARRWHAATATAGVGAGAGARAVRTVEVGGADEELRLSLRARRRHNLPQHALDHAIVEECARWLLETAETAAAAAAGGDDVDADHNYAEQEEEEYAHLLGAPPVPPAPPASLSAPQPPPSRHGIKASGNRAIEIVEGRVVSRGNGATPLALPPPRRAPSAPPPPAPSPAPAPPPPPSPVDIMNMPIVFADDSLQETVSGAGAGTRARGRPAGGAEVKGAPSAVTVKSGGGGGRLKYSKVIVAKRGGAAGGRVGVGVTAGGGLRGRPIVVRAGVRLVRTLPPPPPPPAHR